MPGALLLSVWPGEASLKATAQTLEEAADWHRARAEPAKSSVLLRSAGSEGA